LVIILSVYSTGACERRRAREIASEGRRLEYICDGGKINESGFQIIGQDGSNIPSGSGNMRGGVTRGEYRVHVIKLFKD